MAKNVSTNITYQVPGNDLQLVIDPTARREDQQVLLIKYGGGYRWNGSMQKFLAAMATVLPNQQTVR